MSFIRSTVAYAIAGSFSLAAIIVSCVLIRKHLRNYNAPALQKSVIRILVIVPVYALTSWLSLIYVDGALYFNIFRDCYEVNLEARVCACVH